MFEQDSKHLAILALVLGLATAASAVEYKWNGAKVDANGVGFWDEPGNWIINDGTLPSFANKDKAVIDTSNQTVVVDDWDPNTLKEADVVNLAWGTWSKNLTILIKSSDGSGPGGVLKARALNVCPAGGQNCTIVVDAGRLDVTGRLRTCDQGTNNASASIIVNGGTVNLARLSLTEKEAAGQATLTVNGGQVNVAQDITVGKPPAVARINLNGGLLSVGQLLATPALAIDVNEGTLVLKNDQRVLIDQLVGSGQLTIGGQTAQRGGLFVAYDAQTQTTTVTADPSIANVAKAWAPQPQDKTSGVPADTQLLIWSAGDSTAAKAGHDVYFGMDLNAVSNDSASNALGTYRGRVDAASMPMPVELMLSQAYYWRVDQIDSKGTITKGNLWSFTVATSRMVDDFEAYDNQEPNQIYTTWKDGVGLAGNGMRVGHWDPNYAETKIVKQGMQSMPLFYDTNAVVVNAEAKRTFASAQNWSKNGAKSLSLKFRGESANTFGTVYVKINDTKVAYPLLASHMQFAQWKPWIINFKDVAADLTKVTSLAIGVDGPGSGTLYIDDIRLYAREAELMPAPGSGVEPEKKALVARYLLNGDGQDSSGNGRHGQVKETATWVSGVFDGALDFTLTKGMDCGDFDPTGGTGKFTLSAWCYWENSAGVQHLVTKSAGWAAATHMFQVELKGSETWVEGVQLNQLVLASAAFPQQASCGSVPTREWVHLALVFDGTHATGYVNGIDSKGPQPTGIGANIAAPVYIGASPVDTGSRVLKGLLDDVRLYNYPLTPAEVLGTIGVDLGYKPF